MSKEIQIENEGQLKEFISSEMNDFGKAAKTLIGKLNDQKKKGTFIPALMAGVISAGMIGAGILFLPAVAQDLPSVLPNQNSLSQDLLYKAGLELRVSQLPDGAFEVIIAGVKPESVQSSEVGVRAIFAGKAK